MFLSLDFFTFGLNVRNVNAAVTTLEGCEGKLRYPTIDTRNVNKNNLLSKDIMTMNVPHVH